MQDSSTALHSTAYHWTGVVQTSATLPPAPLKSPPQCRDGSPPHARRGDGHKVTVLPLGGGLHHTMVALKLQQFQGKICFGA